MSDSLTTSAESISISTIPAQLLLAHIANLEKEKHELEFKLKECEKHYNELKLTADSYLETVHSLREERELLREEKLKLEKQIAELTAQLYDLKDENTKLKGRVLTLENQLTQFKNAHEETNKELKIAQCVYDYKQKLKMQIGLNLPDKWDLFDILQGDYDSKLTPIELDAKNTLVGHINTTHESVKQFKRALKEMTIVRLTLAHPNIADEYATLQPEFLNYCNAKWPRDVKYNKIFTDDIFNKLIE